MPFAPGERVGPYRLEEILGQGGMATVWKAYHTALDRYVAIKVLHPAFKDDQTFLTRFDREAKIVAKLVHPHIVPVYDFDRYEEMPYLVMRYVEGETLKAILKEGPLTLERVMEILRPVGEALAYAHSQGVLHMDIKPSNIIETPQGEVLLTDFGLARIMGEADLIFSRDMMVGTPQYISPEQARGEELDVRTDIYSLGVILFEMVAGRVPFDGDTPHAIIHHHLYSPLPSPSQFRSGLPPKVEEVIVKALAKGREERYQSVGEMMVALGVTTPLESFPRPAIPSVEAPRAKARPRFPWLLLSLGFLLLLLALACCGLFWAWRG